MADSEMSFRRGPPALVSGFPTVGNRMLRLYDPDPDAEAKPTMGAFLNDATGFDARSIAPSEVAMDPQQQLMLGFVGGVGHARIDPVVVAWFGDRGVHRHFAASYSLIGIPGAAGYRLTGVNRRSLRTCVGTYSDGGDPLGDVVRRE